MSDVLNMWNEIFLCARCKDKKERKTEEFKAHLALEHGDAAEDLRGQMLMHLNTGRQPHILIYEWTLNGEVVATSSNADEAEAV